MSDSDAHSSTATAPALTDARAGMLAPIRETALAPIHSGQSSYSSPGSADPLAGGIDFQRVWHAFRRRWIPSLVVALALAGAAGAATFLMMPRGFESVSWLRVRDKAGSFLGGDLRDNAEYEAYRKTQVQLIKSPLVLMAALRRPGMETLGMLKHEDDKVGWLARNVLVSAPMESEVIQVRLRGESPQEITKVVNAVTDAYLTDVVNKERAERLRRRDMLENKGTSFYTNRIWQAHEQTRAPSVDRCEAGTQDQSDALMPSYSHCQKSDGKPNELRFWHPRMSS